MRFNRAVVAALGVAAAMFVGAGASSAAPAGVDHGPLKPKGDLERNGQVGVQKTNGNSFLEINNAGELVYWTRAGESFSRQVRGWGWQNTHQITSLDPNRFIEVKPDYRLALWTWRGTGYTEQIIGIGWQGAKIISGVASNAFIEINSLDRLVYWSIAPSGALTAKTIGTGWSTTRLLAGLDNLDFLEVETPEAGGGMSEWIDNGAGLAEFPFEDPPFNWIRLMAGTDINHFVVIEDGTGDLLEVAWVDSEKSWIVTQRGNGWGGTRLLG